jgi:hypothetical protein
MRRTPRSSRPTVRLALAGVLVTAALVTASPPSGAATSCPAFRPAYPTGKVTGLSSIREISGVVASRTYRRTLWIQQDGGNPERIDAIRPDGSARASISITGARNRDWEDIGLWDRRLWIGDIGDNGRKLGEIQIYWFREPKLRARSVAAKTLHLRYPDGAHNAEAMFVTGGNLYIVSKEKTLETGTVYRADVSPLRDGAFRAMQRVATVPIGNISAADVGERGIVIRNYRHALLFRWRGDRSVARALAGSPCDVEVGPGAESIAFSSWNRSTFSIPEGTSPPVYVNRPR